MEGTPTAVNATDKAASTAPKPPGVGTAEPSVFAKRKIKVVSTGFVWYLNASNAAQNPKPVPILRMSAPTMPKSNSFGLVSTSTRLRAYDMTIGRYLSVTR